MNVLVSLARVLGLVPRCRIVVGTGTGPLFERAPVRRRPPRASASRLRAVR